MANMDKQFSLRQLFGAETYFSAAVASFAFLYTQKPPKGHLLEWSAMLGIPLAGHILWGNKGALYGYFLTLVVFAMLLL